MKQTVARSARAESRSARLAKMVAEANGKAPAGVRLIDTQRSLSAAEIRKGKSLEKLARAIRNANARTLAARK